VLSPALPHLRLLAMSHKELADVVSGPRLLSSEESLTLFVCKGRGDASALPAGLCPALQPRQYREPTHFTVEGCSPDLLWLPPGRSNTFTISIGVIAYTFVANSQYNHVGLVLPSQVKEGAAANDSYTEEVTLQVKDAEGAMLSVTHFKAIGVEYNSTFDVPHDNPVNLPSSGSMTILLHKSGTYPLQFPSQHNVPNFPAGVRYPFGPSRINTTLTRHQGDFIGLHAWSKKVNPM